MESSTISPISVLAGYSMVKSANKLPELAGELIEKTMQSMQQSSLYEPERVPQASFSPNGDIGTIIDIIA